MKQAIKGDTIRFKVPMEHIQSYDTTQFKTLLNTETDVAESTTAKDLKYITGLNEVTVNHDGIIFTLSAKFRRDEYLKGFHYDNMLDVLQDVQNTGYVRFTDVRKVFNSSDVLRIDVNNTIQCDNILNLLLVLNKYKVNTDWNVKLDNVPTNKGITFTRDIKTNPIRFIGYCKQTELLMPRNRNLIESYPKIFNDSANLFRMETNLRNFENMRKQLSVNDLKLKTVLSSDENVNLNILNKITSIKVKPTVKTFATKKQHSAYKEAKMMLMEAGYDLSVVESNLLLEVPSLRNSRNLSKYMERYEAYALEVQDEKLKMEGVDSDGVLRDLKQRLECDFNS